MMDADQIASSMADLWEYLLPWAPGLRMVRKGGAYAMVNDLPSPVNGVYFERRDPDPGAVTALLDEVAAAGLPYTLSVRPGDAGAFAQLAIERGLAWADDLPLMLLETAAARRPAPVPGFGVRELAPAEVARHVAVAVAGFGFPAEAFEQIANPDLLAVDGYRCYLGELNGEPVATGISVTFGPLTGLFSIATVPGRRGRGFGTAITARAISDAGRAGSAWCWLQSSPDGHPIYEGLGFRTVETWPTWQSPE